MSESEMYDTMEACLNAGHDQAYCETHIKQEPAPTGDKAPKNPSIAAELVTLKQKNAQLDSLARAQSDEIKLLRAQLQESNASKEAEIRAKLYPVIQDAIPTITKVELDEMKPVELATFARTLARVDRAPDRKSKPNLIVASSDAVQGTHVLLDHMPNVYGKSRDQILKEYGV